MHDKANKHRRTRGMPRHRTAMKDAGSGETLVRGAPTFDHKVSEWDNPLSLRSVHPAMDGQTRGTETSNYPEEKKSTEIPLVAASEAGAAQTAFYAGSADTRL